MHPLLAKLARALEETQIASRELEAEIRRKGANPATMKSARTSGFSAQRQTEALMNLAQSFETILTREEPKPTEAAPAEKTKTSKK